MDTINEGVAGVARGCGEGVVSINNKGFSPPGFSATADFLLDRLFDFRLQRVLIVGVESGRVRGRKGAAMAVGTRRK